MLDCEDDGGDVGRIKQCGEERKPSSANVMVFSTNLSNGQAGLVDLVYKEGSKEGTG